MPEHQRITALPNYLYARELKTSGIYSITCTANNAVYIGSAVSISLRWRAHYRQLQCGKHHNARIQNAWKKYGPDAFVFSVIEHCPITDLIEREQYHLDACSADICANLSQTAGSLLGFKHSLEACEKLRQRMIGNKPSAESIERSRIARLGIAARPAGWKMTDDQKEMLSAAHTGRKHTDETKAKVAAASTGRLHSDEAKRKITDGKAKFTREQVAQIRDEYLNTPQSINAIAKSWGVLNWTISKLLRALPPYDYFEPLEIKPKPLTEEAKANISAATKGVPKPEGFGNHMIGNTINVGRKHTPEHIAKAHEHMFGNQFTAGRPLSDAHRLAISNTTKGKSKPPEFAEKMRGNKNAAKRQPTAPLLFSE
jgi:group I intron endonuclease